MHTSVKCKGHVFCNVQGPWCIRKTHPDTQHVLFPLLSQPSSSDITGDTANLLGHVTTRTENAQFLALSVFCRCSLSAQFGMGVDGQRINITLKILKSSIMTPKRKCLNKEDGRALHQHHVEWETWMAGYKRRVQTLSQISGWWYGVNSAD